MIQRSSYYGAKSIPIPLKAGALWLILLSCFSCWEKQTEDCFNPFGNCVSVNQNNTYQYLYKAEYNYQFPSFNPNNPQEFCFVKEHGTESGIYKYNLTTNQTTTIIQDPLLSISDPITWFGNDQILFTNSQNKKIYKIKSDGSGLTQLSHINSDYGACYNGNYSRILYSSYHESEYAWYAKLCDSNGVVLDSLDIGFGSIWEYTADGKFARSSYNSQFQTFDANDIHLVTTYTFSWSYSNAFHYSAIYRSIMGSHQLIGVSYYGTFRIDIDNLTVVQIRENCESRLDKSISISADGTKMLIHQLRYIRMADCKVEMKDEILYMNIDGSDVKRIEFTE